MRRYSLRWLRQNRVGGGSTPQTPRLGQPPPGNIESGPYQPPQQPPSYGTPGGGFGDGIRLQPPESIGGRVGQPQILQPPTYGIDMGMREFQRRQPLQPPPQSNPQQGYATPYGFRGGQPPAQYQSPAIYGQPQYGQQQSQQSQQPRRNYDVIFEALFEYLRRGGMR